MKEVIIVGRGLAAICLAHELHKRNISFVIIGASNLSRSSHVAAGIWNPVVFKRLTKSWMADQLIPALNLFYTDCEKLLGEKFIEQKKIIREFKEEQDETLWKMKSKNELEDYLDSASYPADSAPKGSNIKNNYSKVLNAGTLDVSKFIQSTEAYFIDNIREEVFEYKKLEVSDSKVRYKDLEANAIIFCEGWLVKNNPFFNWVPFKPVKGEVLTLNIPAFELDDEILNADAFLFRKKSGEFKSGATYEWEQLDEIPTDEASKELVKKFQNLCGLPYTILKHEAGVRPSTIDRRPVIGCHPERKNIFIFNGLGTKGVMIAPYIANKVVNFYLEKENPLSEINVNRFYKFYEYRTQG